MLEDEVLAALWTFGRPVTPAEVQLELGDRLAYTTVMSTLTRLRRKNLVTREPTARGAYAYAPTMDEADHTARAMTELLDRRRDRAGALTRFLSSLPPEDEALLQRLLRMEDGP
jgi:predicted transcriptional regulator